jgi:REP-associated tyrosine transposase
VLTGDHLDLLREVFADVCADFGARQVRCNGEDDHVHLLATYSSARPDDRANHALNSEACARWIRVTCGGT